MRGKTRACKYIISKISEHLEDSEETIIIGHANTPEDAAYLVQELNKAKVNNPVMLTCLSATIASHVGPGMLAVASWESKCEKNK